MLKRTILHQQWRKSTTIVVQGQKIQIGKGYDTQCRSVAVNAMKSLIDSLTSLLRPAQVLELSMPGISPGYSLPIPMVLMSEKIDAKMKIAEGRIQSAAGELTGNLGDKVKGASKQVQGSTMDTLADLRKPEHKGNKDT
jgi:uncharacterized protein YjbJ (UPF0337 family)